MPRPGGSGSVQNLLAVGLEDAPMNQLSIRLDHRLSARDNIFGRFSTYSVSDQQPFGTSSLNETLVPGFGRTVTTDSRNLAFSYARSFGASLLNEVRFGFLSASGGQVSPNQGVNF